ncbi:MAG: retroviral-like aspartic protease family protein [Candidatus Cloacimonetes bacterium]|nr:retroviral-like aspartic protease family protein [Candidatus Cloacimonadota bacterium]
MSIEFPFLYFNIESIGRIFRPLIPVSLKTIKGWQTFHFIVDTGSDLTTLPHRFIKVLGIDVKKCRKGEAEGLGGYRSRTLQVEIPIKVKNYETVIRASMVEDDKTPLLLGRVDLLDDKFSWFFDTKRKKIIFEEI